jgi:hypothetical protein
VRAENAKGMDSLVEARESVGRVLRVAISSCIREPRERYTIFSFQYLMMAEIQKRNNLVICVAKV